MSRTTIRGFINKHRIRMTADLTDANPNMDDSTPEARDWQAHAYHWRCVLRAGRHQMTVIFSMGQALDHEPTAAEVLECLLSDAAGFENARGFEDWARDLGYDVDSRKAERTYKTIEAQARKLRALLGVDAYNVGCFELEQS